MSKELHELNAIRQFVLSHKLQSTELGKELLNSVGEAYSTCLLATLRGSTSIAGTLRSLL